MCGRYSLHHSTEEVVERFKAQLLPFELEQRFNVAPSQAVAVVTERAPNEEHPEAQRNLEVFKWGLVPFWVKDLRSYKPLINARSETLVEKNSFKNALARRRCLILSDGFYEWKKTETRRRIPMHIRLKSAQLFAFAGIWEVWKNADGDKLKTCAIITVPANDLVADIHDRMPAILQPEDEDKWLNPEETDLEYLCSLLKPYASEEMEAYPVSTIVNSPAIDSEECIVYTNPEQVFEPVPISRRRGALIVAEKVEALDTNAEPVRRKSRKKVKEKRSEREAASEQVTQQQLPLEIEQPNVSRELSVSKDVSKHVSKHVPKHVAENLSQNALSEHANPDEPEAHQLKLQLD